MATDAQIRDAIRDVIVAVHATARVYSWNVLSHDLADWPGLFTTAAGGRHGWIIKRASASAEWKGSGGRDRQMLSYDVWGFYGFRTGKLDDNSDDEFSVIVDAVYAAIKASPKLGLECIEEHGLLQWQRITTMNCGEETLHIAMGRLDVIHCC